MNLRWDAIWCILRHNFEKYYSVCNDLVVSGWFFQCSYLYTILITIFFWGGGGSWAFWRGEAFTPQIPWIEPWRDHQMKPGKQKTDIKKILTDKHFFFTAVSHKTYLGNPSAESCHHRSILHLHLVLDWCRFLFECADFPRKCQLHSRSRPTNLTSHHSLWGQNVIVIFQVFFRDLSLYKRQKVVI